MAQGTQGQEAAGTQKQTGTGPGAGQGAQWVISLPVLSLWCTLASLGPNAHDNDDDNDNEGKQQWTLSICQALCEALYMH